MESNRQEFSTVDAALQEFLQSKTASKYVEDLLKVVFRAGYNACIVDIRNLAEATKNSEKGDSHEHT